MTIERIITHPGGAHKDDFLACSVLLALHPVAVFRQEPEPGDLADAAVAVVDVGNSHDPKLHNFDHHQFSKDETPTCALSLVLQHLGVYQDALKFCDWLEPAEWFDCRGPVATAEWMGVERDALTRLNSPIDVTLLRRFALHTELLPGNPLWEVMRMIGEDLLDYIRNLRQRLDFIAAHAQIWSLNHVGGSFQVLFMPRTDPLPNEPSMGLGRFIESQGLDGVVGMIYPDRRGDGYGLSRYNDDLRLDFRRINQEADVHFAHKQGFVAKSSATELKRLKELMTTAWAGGGSASSSTLVPFE
ncbi:MAG: MYG1 family protein [Opitutales bacterium]|nr:MYG1 family protein [Opitutales bacterium]